MIVMPSSDTQTNLFRGNNKKKICVTPTLQSNRGRCNHHTKHAQEKGPGCITVPRLEKRFWRSRFLPNGVETTFKKLIKKVR